jgi:hypothetical protein
MAMRFLLRLFSKGQLVFSLLKAPSRNCLQGQRPSECVIR